MRVMSYLFDAPFDVVAITDVTTSDGKALLSARRRYTVERVYYDFFGHEWMFEVLADTGERLQFPSSCFWLVKDLQPKEVLHNTGSKGD